MSGLGFRGCDLDLYVQIDSNTGVCGLQPCADEQQKMLVVAKMLKGLPLLCSNIVRIAHTRVPIVRFNAPQLGGIQCDMSFRDSMSCHRSRLIGWLMKAGQWLGRIV